MNAQVADPSVSEGFIQNTFTPGATAKMALGLLYAQGTDSVPEWGSGRAGLARRAEWLGAGWMATATTEYAVARFRGVDTSYHLCACKGFPKRAAHALHSGFVEYRADGSATFAVARFSGIAAGSLATIPMLPSPYGFRNAAGRAGITLGVDEGFNMLQEFRKEIVRTLLLRGNH